ncbi:MAG: HU family DNA-binding protein [Thermodesulfovibrionia bacterium]|nr:HU family DNA-binding protein [Thermodesulfovibrionia bacterium]
MPKPGTVTKAKIIDAVAERNGFTRKKSIDTVEILLELIKQSLESGDDVLISGFGKFCVKKKKKEKIYQMSLTSISFKRSGFSPYL